MEKWREDAQPEWPQAASATREVPVIGGEAEEAFSDTEATGTAADTRGPEILEGGRHAAKVGRKIGTDGRHGGTDGRHTGKDSRRTAKDGRRIQTGWPEPPAGKDVSAVGAGILADPWGASPETGTGTEGGAADPDEVTVQLDGPSRHAEAGGKSGTGNDASDRPVFVDESGRRSRRYRRFGMAVGIACAVYAVVIVITLLSGSSDAPWLPVPGQKDDAPAGKVDTSPLPAESGQPSGGSGSVAPGNIPTASDGTTPSPGVSVTGTAGASAKPGSKASASASPKPSTSKSATAPTGGGASNPVVQPSLPASSPPASTPSTVTSAPSDPTPTPSATTGTGTVADAPSTPSPVAQGPAAPSDPAPAPSTTPEHIL
ncbi:hypothetical protein ACGFY9_38045 [Streptomyces sp. NPDC048504]|uniref:hypothetical protein n=1 Tax=Streptomyces sp. NPDC048504 TaxID=3365559 RepID=UPI00371DADA0